MPDEQWQALVESVLTNVEPNDALRARLKARLRDDSTLGMLWAAWHSGGDSTEIARVIRHLAIRMRS